MALLRSDAIIIFFITISATFIRIYGIDAYGLWYDEGLTIAISKWPIIDMVLLPTDPTPFLYYFLHQIFISPDYSAGAVRYLSLIFGSISIPIMYILARMCFSRQAGLMASALLAVWTIHIEYSQEARAYALLFLFTLLSSVGVIGYASTLASTEIRRSKENLLKRLIFLSIFIVGSVGSFYVHFVSIFWISITVGIIFVVVKINFYNYLREIYTCFAILGVLFIPGLMWLFMRVFNLGAFSWLSQESPLGVLKVTSSVFLPIGLWENSFTRSMGIVEITQVSVFLSAVGALIISIYWRRTWIFNYFKSQPIVLYLIVGYIFVPIIFWLFGFIIRPILQTSTILFAAPGSILIISWLCLDKEHRIYPMPAAIILALFVTSTTLYGYFRDKFDWRDAKEYLASVISPNDVIIICPARAYPSIRHNTPQALGASVLVNRPPDAERRLVLIERGLGQDPLWDQSAFRNIIIPSFEASTVLSPIIAKPTARKKDLFITLEEGEAVWIIDRKCTDTRKSLFLDVLNTTASSLSTMWVYISDTPNSAPVVIERYIADRQILIKVDDGTM